VSLAPRTIDEAHARSDVDSSVWAFHHTLGTKSNQAAKGNHKHPEYENGGGGGTPIPGPPGRDGLGLKRFSSQLGTITAGVELSIAHNLNEDFVDVTFRRVSTKTVIEFPWRTIDVNHIGVLSDLGFTSNSIDVLVLSGSSSGGAAGAVFEQTFASASTTWVVNHNLNTQYVEVNCFNLAGTVEYDPDITYNSLNQCTVNWYNPTTGIVRVMA
jgi:hypothetical protein